MHSFTALYILRFRSCRRLNQLIYDEY